jgi:hypothetical protein
MAFIKTGDDKEANITNIIDPKSIPAEQKQAVVKVLETLETKQAQDAKEKSKN